MEETPKSAQQITDGSFTIDALEALIDLLQDRGVSLFEGAGIRLAMGPKPKIPVEAPAPEGERDKPPTPKNDFNLSPQYADPNLFPGGLCPDVD